MKVILFSRNQSRPNCTAGQSLAARGFGARALVSSAREGRWPRRTCFGGASAQHPLVPHPCPRHPPQTNHAATAVLLVLSSLFSVSLCLPTVSHFPAALAQVPSCPRPWSSAPLHSGLSPLSALVASSQLHRVPPLPRPIPPLPTCSSGPPLTSTAETVINKL